MVSAANDTEFGMMAYVAGEDLGEVAAVTQRLQAGIVSVNIGIASDPSAPFGGVKESVMGREGSHEGLAKYLEPTYVRLPLCGPGGGGARPGEGRRLPKEWPAGMAGVAEGPRPGDGRRLPKVPTVVTPEGLPACCWRHVHCAQFLHVGPAPRSPGSGPRSGQSVA